MRREDIVWLMVKGAGVWLLVSGVENLPHAMAMIFDAQARWVSTYIEPWITSLGLILLGGLLLFVNEERWLRAINSGNEPVPSGNEAATASGPPTSMTREDWLWVGLKLVGAWVAAMSLIYMPSFWSMALVGPGTTGGMLGLAGAACGTVFGLWLLLGNQIWRWACRT